MQKKEPLALQTVLFSGAKESRTPDLLHAMQALYQLSYNPEGWRKYRIDIYPCQGKKKNFFQKK